MRKCDKERIKRSKLQQNIAKARRRVYSAYAAQVGHRQIGELFADPNLIINVVKSLSPRTLKLVANFPDRFIFLRKEELHRLATDAIAEITMKLEKE